MRLDIVPLLLVGSTCLLVACGQDGKKEVVEETDGRSEVKTVCREGTTRCNEDGLAVEQCAAGGHGWEEEQVCRATEECFDGQCVVSCGSCQVRLAGVCSAVGVSSCPEGWDATEDCGCAPPGMTFGEMDVPDYGRGKVVAVGPTCGGTWKADHQGGCTVELAECPAGEFSLIGIGCHPVGLAGIIGPGGTPPELTAGCGGEGADEWGTLPSDVADDELIFVLKGAPTEKAAGTKLWPYPDIQTGVDAAEDGDWVIIGAPDEGAVYGAVEIGNKDVNLKGRCAPLVTLAETGPTAIGATAALYVHHAGEVVVDGLTATADGSGIVVYWTDNVTLRNLRAKDNAGTGISLSDVYKPGQLEHSGARLENVEVTGNHQGAIAGDFGEGLHVEYSHAVVVDSLISDNEEHGINAPQWGCVEVDRTVIRNTLSEPLSGLAGAGISFGLMSRVMVRNARLSNNRGAGIVAGINETEPPGITCGSHDLLVRETIIEGTVPSDTVTYEDGNPVSGLGDGIAVVPPGKCDQDVAIESSAILNNTADGIFVGICPVKITGTLVSDTVGLSDTFGGRGIELFKVPDAEITGCTIANNVEAGILAEQSGLVLNYSVVRGTKERGDGDFGLGIQLGLADDQTATISNSAIVGNTKGGVLITGGLPTISQTLIADTVVGPANPYARGLEIRYSSEAKVLGSMVRGNREVGVLVDSSTVTIESTLIADTGPNVDGLWGAGILVQGNVSAPAATALKLLESAVVNSGGIGVRVHQAHATVDSSLISMVGEPPSKASWIASPGDEPEEFDVADGISVTHHGEVTVENTTISGCGRFGTIWEESNGAVNETVFIDNETAFHAQYGSVVGKSGIANYGNVQAVVPDLSAVFPTANGELPATKPLGADSE